MNPALIKFFEDQADTVVLTVILNGQTTISREYIIQTLLETYNMGVGIGTKAIAPDDVVPTLPADAPPEPIGLDQGIVN